MTRKAEFLITFTAALVLELLAVLAYSDTTGRPVVIGDAIIWSASLAGLIAWAATSRRLDR
jgi:hypothetical protein